MDERLLSELPPWLTEAGLAGASEADIVIGFCDRCVAAGIPLGRAHVFIDTLHPVHEGRLFRWGYPDESPMHEYGRTGSRGLMQRAPYLWMLRQPRSGEIAPSIAC
jgi:adenylate cyclase